MAPVIYITCLLGIICRTHVPYLLTLCDNPNTPFDRKFLIPAVISVIVNLLIAPFVFQTLPAGADWIAAYIVGCGATDISRDALKFVGGSVPALHALK
jgi:hypothetical protein